MSFTCQTFLYLVIFFRFQLHTIDVQKSQALVKYQTALEEIGTEELEEQMDAASGGKPRHKLHMVLLQANMEMPSS